jgi:hypothetical protein
MTLRIICEPKRNDEIGGWCEQASIYDVGRISTRKKATRKTNT